MVNFVILFLLFLAYVVAALVGAGSEFTLFIIFVALAGIAVRRWNASEKMKSAGASSMRASVA